MKQQSKAMSNDEAMLKLKEQHKSRMEAFEAFIWENFTLKEPLSEIKKRKLLRKIREKSVFFQESIDIMHRIFRPETSNNLTKRFK